MDRGIFDYEIINIWCKGRILPAFPGAGGSIKGDMHKWQLCHLAMVVPIADAYYEAEFPQMAGKERIPMPILTMALSLIFCSSFGNRFMYQHSVKAPDEMKRLHKQFYTYVKTHR